MVQHLIKEARSLEEKDSEHWRGLARSLAGELEHYFKGSRLNGRLAGRYRLQYMEVSNYATALENVLIKYLNICNVCNGDESARWNCPACSEHWELLTDAKSSRNVSNIEDMRDDQTTS